MIPTSIDGTDITGATIDGTDVTEITVDGQTVFSAQTLPVAYSNLVAWYPFDSATYGGSNADDVTALFNPAQSGDSTAYDGTVNGATYQSSGGVTDINAGANSGAFNFDGSNDTIIPPFPNVDFDQPNTIMGWANADTAGSGGGNMIVTFGFSGADDPFYFIDMFDNSDFRFIVEDNFGNNDILTTGGFTQNTSFHVAGVFDGSNYNLFVDGSLEVSQSKSIGSVSNLNQMGIGVLNRDDLDGFFDGRIDDVRIYDTDLSSSQINQIYQNTQP
jgi:hypothetical protein